MIEGVSLREALGLPALQGVRVLAGGDGLHRMVRFVNVMEVPDILDWVKPDELLLTTAYPLRDDRAALSELVPRLAQRGLAGLAVKPARYIDEVPPVMREAADRLAFPLLELPPETALADIINAVLSLILNRQALRLARSAAVHERFTAIVLSGGGAREIAHVLAELIDCPVALVDAQGEVLARSSGFPADALADFASLGAYLQPIQAGPDVLGATVVLPGSTALADDQLMAIEHASTVAALRLVQARVLAEADRRFQATCLDELVTGHLTDWAVLHERASAFGWDLSVPRAVLLAEIEGVGERHRLLDGARGVLGRDAIIWERSAGVAALLPAGEIAERARALQSRLSGLVLRIGIGRVYADPFAWRSSFTEALRALSLGRRGSGGVYAYEDLGLHRLLLACPAAELAAFRDDALGPLLAYEREHSGCSLLLTLAAFLENNRNIAATARALFVHYNTVRYRLERIEHLQGPFIDDARRCLTLDLALEASQLLPRGQA